MMISAMGFRALTNQLDTPVDKMRSMSYADIENRMVESFAHEMKEDASTGKPAMLQLGELKKMAAVVLAGLDSNGGDDVSFEEFVQASSSNEYVDSKTMAHFFDDDNKPHRFARMFDPTRSQIKKINRKVRASLESALTSYSPGKADVQNVRASLEPALIPDSPGEADVQRVRIRAPLQPKIRAARPALTPPDSPGEAEVVLEV